MVVTFITSEKAVLQRLYYKSFSYQNLSEQATLLISILMSKICFIGSSSDWLFSMLNIEHRLLMKLEVPGYVNLPKQFRNSFALNGV